MPQQNNDNLSSIGRLLRGLSRSVLGLVLAAIALIIIVVGLLLWLNRNDHVAITQDRGIEVTPTLIRSIESIGEWEFLAVSDEELVDTLRYGFFGDSELARIYYGTLRLGVNLHKAAPGWIKVEGDSIVATLPPIELLDADFIDEARTQSFYESGSWSEEARKALYDKACRQMRERCLTPENIDIAKRNARLQFTDMLRSMGFERVSVRFSDDQQKIKRR